MNKEFSELKHKKPLKPFGQRRQLIADVLKLKTKLTPNSLTGTGSEMIGRIHFDDNLRERYRI
jgi:hypothetical protein